MRLVAGLLIGALVLSPSSGAFGDTLIKSTPNGATPYLLCAEHRFPEFLEAFVEKVDLQKKYTRFPLKKSFTVDSNPEPKRITKLLNFNEVQYPVFPNHEEQKRHDLTMKIDAVNKTTKKVTLFKRDTDYQIKFVFRKNGCWNLISVEDESL